VGITSELLLTRHGQAHCNIAGVVGGPETWTGLTDLGRQQVKALAARLLDEHERSAIAAVSSGPRLRLKESGHIVAEALELPLVIKAGLDGPHHGEADGRPWYEVKNAFRGFVLGCLLPSLLPRASAPAVVIQRSTLTCWGRLSGRHESSFGSRFVDKTDRQRAKLALSAIRLSTALTAAPDAQSRSWPDDGFGAPGAAGSDKRRRPLAADRLGRACSRLGPQSFGPIAISGT